MKRIGIAATRKPPELLERGAVVMSDGAFSIREALQGALADFIRGSGFKSVAAEEMLRELVSLLAAYREEGTLLFPEVFVVPDEATLASLAPGVPRITIGEAPLDGNFAQRLLKACAPLADDGWAAYVIATEPAVFGLVRAQRHSFATSAEEAMMGLGCVLLIRNRGHFVVELKNSKDARYTVSFTSRPASASPLAEHVKAFAQAAGTALDAERQSRFIPYLERLLIGILQKCHGTLLAVLTEVSANTEGLEAATWLSPPISLASIHFEATTKQDATSLADLQGIESLLAGMVGSDGLVVFGPDGTIRGYRVFLKASDEERLKISDQGGGRRRTYELMKLRTQSFSQILFRSQDGATGIR